MKEPFTKFQKDHDEKIIQSVLDAIHLLSKRSSEREIHQETGLQEEDTRRLKEVLRKGLDKTWDEIDKVADLNGGHYVELTKPDEVDTSDVSE